MSLADRYFGTHRREDRERARRLRELEERARTEGITKDEAAELNREAAKQAVAVHEAGP